MILNALSLITRLLRALPPEVAHNIAIAALSRSPFQTRLDPGPSLAVEAFGLRFPHPLGLAAGFDKNAQAFSGLWGLGFAFVEVGTLTPKAQAGNPKPRLFRLPQERALINRMGFNNDGFAAAAERIKRSPRLGILGINIGPNKDSEDRVADYVLGVKQFTDLADYLVINISSPNTPGLRHFHARKELEHLLSAVLAIRRHCPLLLKISPDLDDNALEDVLAAALYFHLDGLIVANTSIHENLPAKGGLSGRPLFSPSTRLLARCFLKVGGTIPLIGVGGVENAATALTKIEAGACLLQVYTGFVYKGPRLVQEIVRGLREETKRHGPIAAIIGTRAQEIAASHHS